MRTLLHAFWLIILSVIALSGCTGKDDRLPVFRWSPAGQQFDSLTLVLENYHLNDTPVYKWGRHIDEMERLSKSATGDTARIRKARVLFWKAMNLRKDFDYDRADEIVSEALQLTDSVRDHYDWVRFTNLREVTNDTVNGTRRYRHHVAALDYAREIGDLPLEANSYMVLGNMMANIGYYDKSLDYLRKSDSIYSLLGFWKVPVKNRINVARTLNWMDRTPEADSILRSLEGDPALAQDTFAMNLLPRNLYSYHRHDTTATAEAYLYKAHDMIKDYPKYRFLRGLYRGLLVERKIDNGEWDSVQYYARLAMEDLPYAHDYIHKAVIWNSNGLAMAYEGNADSALTCRIMFEIYVDSTRRAESEADVIKIATLRDLQLAETRNMVERTRRNWAVAILLTLIVAISLITILIINRRHIRKQMLAVANELELEKAKRKMAAIAVMIQEKDTVLDSLRSELAELRKVGEIRERSARQLEGAISRHLSNHEQEEQFMSMFDTVNPGFTERLRERCPNIAESYVKLACYTLMELDNKKIASLMMIRPESVHQARWRLRKRLGVPDHLTLEEYLRELNSI